MKKREQTILKERPFGLYGLALERIKRCEKIKGQIISFPVLFETLCRSFQIKKQEAWEILFILRDLEFIKIVPMKGVITK